jgi:glycosyltransferase involved in cell wall biosynthesis
MVEELLISVALATYNGARYLGEQLDSLAAQQRLPSELVVTDDGSTDDTLGLLERFSKSAPFPVRVYCNSERLGPEANFLRAASLCRHALISFCDQDDVWQPENLLKVASCFDDPDVLMVFHNALVVDAVRTPISPFYYEPPVPARSGPLDLRPWAYSYGFTQTFRATLLPVAREWRTMEDHFQPGKEMGHDVFFFLVASGLGAVCYVDEILTEYRQHDGNVSGAGKRIRPGLIERWRYRLENRAASYRHLGKVAALDAAMFDRLSRLNELAPLLRQRAATAAATWRILADLYADRATVCSGVVLARVSAFLRLCRAGAYGEDAFWTFGTKAMQKDLILGVLLAPLMQRLGRQPSSLEDRACRRGLAHSSAIDPATLITVSSRARDRSAVI